MRNVYDDEFISGRAIEEDQKAAADAYPGSMYGSGLKKGCGDYQ